MHRMQIAEIPLRAYDPATQPTKVWRYASDVNIKQIIYAGCNYMLNGVCLGLLIASTNFTSNPRYST